MMLKGNTSSTGVSEITGIPVGLKADALFFLHTCHKGNALRGWQRQYDENLRRGRPLPEVPVVFRYRVTYRDGGTEEIPVRWNEGVGHWAVEEPAPVLNAALAWYGPMGNENTREKGTVYSMQWNNPRPEEEITSIDILSGPDGEKWGTPAVFAVTAASAIE
jgi:beta-galactosidase